MYVYILVTYMTYSYVLAIELLPKKTNCVSHSFHSKRCFASCTILTRWSALVREVGVSCGYGETLKRRLALLAKLLSLKYRSTNLYALLCVCSLIMSLYLTVMSVNTHNNSNRLTVVKTHNSESRGQEEAQQRDH